MKKIIVFAAIAATVAFTACTKEVSVENPQEETLPGYVQMRFSATMEADFTKAYLSGTSVLWAGDESIAVFDHDNGGAANKFDVESSGATTSFTGTVPGGIANYTAVYPYSAGITYVAGDGSPVRTEIPAVQEATLGSFDPAAAIFIATATSTDAAFTFTPAFSLFKVNVDVDNVVQVSVSTTTNNLAGSVKVSRSGGLGNGDGELSKTIVLKKSDDSVLAKGVYYIVTRFPATGKSFANFTLKYVTSEALTNSRVSVDGIADTQFARKDILNLGSLSSIPGSAHVSLYEYYQAGFDLELGAKKYNRSVYGDATLIASGTAISSSTFNKKEKGVYFFEGSGSYSNSSEVHISKEVIISSTDITLPATLTFGTDKSWCLNSGSLVMNGISFDNANISATKQSFQMKNATSDFDYLAFFNCKSGNIKKYFLAYNSNSLNYAVKEIVFDHCILGVASTDSPIIVNPNSSNTRVHDFEKFTFSNSVLYNTADTNTQVMLFSYYPSMSDDLTARTWKMEAVLQNNIFYMVASNNSNIRTYKFKSLNITGNIVSCPGYEPASSMKIFTQRVNEDGHGTVVVSNDNIAYAAAGTASYWILADDAFTTKISVTKTLDFLDTNPLTAEDKSTMTFTVAPAYATYGPQAL